MHVRNFYNGEIRKNPVDIRTTNQSFCYLYSLILYLWEQFVLHMCQNKASYQLDL